MSSGLRIPNCRAYKKSYCWLPRKRDSEFCATCAQVKQRDDLRRIIEDLPQSSLTADQIFAVLTKPETALGIQLVPNGSTLDQLLYSLWVRGSQGRDLLRRYIEHMNRTPLRASLLLRVRNHSRTNLCPIYRWILRTGLFQDSLLPMCCLKCLGATALYGCGPAHPERSFELRRWISGPNTPLTQLLRQTLTLSDSLERLVGFVMDLLDSSDPALEQLWQLVLQMIRQLVREARLPFAERLQEMVWQHPGCLAVAFRPDRIQTYGAAAKRTAEARLAPWHEELVAKSWHPSRFQHWVWDEQERQDYGVDHIGQAPPLRFGQAADWNIRW